MCREASGNWLYCIAYATNTFVAVGEADTILQSAVLASVQPELGPVVLRSSGTVQVTMTGLAGQTCSIQASTNLTDWLSINNVTLANPSGQYVDPTATNFPQRLYRAVFNSLKSGQGVSSHRHWKRACVPVARASLNLAFGLDRKTRFGAITER